MYLVAGREILRFKALRGCTFISYSVRMFGISNKQKMCFVDEKEDSVFPSLVLVLLVLYWGCLFGLLVPLCLICCIGAVFIIVCVFDKFIAWILAL
jgi:hypothetical protein